MSDFLEAALAAGGVPVGDDFAAAAEAAGGVPIEPGSGILDEVGGFLKGAAAGAANMVQGPRLGAAFQAGNELLNPMGEDFLDFGKAGSTYERLLKDNFGTINQQQEENPVGFGVGTVGAALAPVGSLANAGIKGAGLAANAIGLGRAGTLAAKTVAGAGAGLTEGALLVQSERQRMGEAESFGDIEGLKDEGLTLGLSAALGGASPLIGGTLAALSAKRAATKTTEFAGDQLKTQVSERVLGLDPKSAERLVSRGDQIDNAPAWVNIADDAKQSVEKLRQKAVAGSTRAFDALNDADRIDGNQARQMLQGFIEESAGDLPEAAKQAQRMLDRLEARNVNAGAIKALEGKLAKLEKVPLKKDPAVAASTIEQRNVIEQQIRALREDIQLTPQDAKTWFQKVVDVVAYNKGKDEGFLEPAQGLAREVRGVIDAQLKNNQAYQKIMTEVAADTAAYNAAADLLKADESVLVGKLKGISKDAERYRQQVSVLETLADRVGDASFKDRILDRRVADVLDGFKARGSRETNAGAAAGAALGFMMGNPILGATLGAGLGFYTNVKGRQWAAALNSIIDKRGPQVAAAMERATAEIGKAVERGGPQAGRAMVALLAKASPEVGSVFEEADRFAGVRAALQAAPYKGPSRNDPPPEINAAITHHMRMANDPTYRRKHQVKAGR